MAYDNVIVFGAGASFDAGIPLLNNFVDTMWSLAIRRRCQYGQLSDDDVKLFESANDIRVELERYNSRANFRLRNLEDVLSLLSFEAMSGEDARANYQTWVKAITRTIELTTRHREPSPQSPEDALNYNRTLYHVFWNALLQEKNPPALITFNYDLVLERTLWDCFHCKANDRRCHKPAKDSCKINYFLKPYDFTIAGEPCQYNITEGISTAEAGHVTSQTRQVPYSGQKPRIEYNKSVATEIPYLKLHGSLNWCSRTTPKQGEPVSPELRPSTSPTSSVETPLILPPVFNKMNTECIIPIWAKALEILRRAKNIIFVGYSLPRTDIYMQYFLKSAVGPNSNLQRIIVFDPVLFGHGESNAEMRNRFQECFSPQFQEQITFEPVIAPVSGGNIASGTFSHFVHNLEHNPQSLFFER